VFTAKPRTDGRGYLGLAFHDTEDSEIDFAAGIAKCREVMLMLLQLGIPVADELLYPELSEYFADLVSWQFLGARSSLDPLHRAVASGIDVAVGVKNSIDGDLKAVVKSVFAVSSSNNYIHNGCQLCTSGNKYSHVVLRGFHDGRNFRKNCNRESVDEVKRLIEEYHLDTNFVMVDCSHANSGKVASNQTQNALDAVGIAGVDGIMLESYLHSGTAKDTFGVSKTDECLSIEHTEKLITDIYNKLK
jgi:3-deoxy-7-phosphoheptulonate synthase